MKSSRATDTNANNSLDKDLELDEKTENITKQDGIKATSPRGKARVRETTTKTKVYVTDVADGSNNPRPTPAQTNGASDHDNAYDEILNLIDDITTNGSDGGMMMHVYLTKDADGRPLPDGRMKLGSIPFYAATWEDDLQRICPMGGVVSVDWRYPYGDWYTRNKIFSFAPAAKPNPNVQQQQQPAAMTPADFQRMQDEQEERFLRKMKLYKDVLGGGGNGNGGDGGLISTIKVLKDLGLVGGQQNNILETVKLIGALKDSFPDSSREPGIVDLVDSFIQSNPGLGSDLANTAKEFLKTRMRPNMGTVTKMRPHADAEVQPEPNAIEAEVNPITNQASQQQEEQESESAELSPEAATEWFSALALMVNDMLENAPVDGTARALVAFAQNNPEQKGFIDNLMKTSEDELIKLTVDTANSLGLAEQAKQIGESKTAKAWFVRLKEKIIEIEKFKK